MNEVTYLTDDGSYITHEELEERCIKYVRNVRLGLNRALTREMLENWLKLDGRLVDLPEPTILEGWLENWDLEFLMKWSFHNDFVNKRKKN